MGFVDFVEDSIQAPRTLLLNVFVDVKQKTYLTHLENIQIHRYNYLIFKAWPRSYATGA